MKRPLALIFVAVALVATALWEAGCASPAPPISVSLSPASAQMDMGQTVGISATLANDTLNKGVSWSLSGFGSLLNPTATSVTYDTNGPLPALGSSSQTATIEATSVADNTKTVSIQITVNPVPQIPPFQSLPSGTTGSVYSQTVTESGGTAPFKWSVFSGEIPNGLSLDSSTGTVSGTPIGGGTWNFELELTDAVAMSTYADLGITINSNIPPGNPVPFVNQPLVPDATSPGGAGFTLTVNGTGFISGATVDFNGAPLTTAFVSSKQLTAQVPSADIAAASTASITVVNPTPGGGRSNALFFSIATPETTANFSNPANSSPQLNGPIAVVVGDFGNGRPDLAVTDCCTSVTVLLSNGDGTFIQAPGSPINMQQAGTGGDAEPDALVVGDFDNSGNLSLAVADGGYTVNNVPILLGNGDGTFTPSSADGTTNDPTACSMAAGDFNRDGNLDAAVGAALYGLNVLLGYGDGAFTLAPNPNNPGYATGCGLAVGDFNGDGKLDLALGSWTDTVSILLGNGDGTFTAATDSPITVGNAAETVVVGDFNGDGKLDLAVANYSDNTVTILLGNGDGTFTPAPGSPIPVGTEPDAIAVGDFTGNGKLDLAVANYGSNNVTLLLGNGDGTFTQAASSPYPVGNGPDSIAAGDFNGDGRLDLAVANSNTVSILLQQ